MVISHDRWFLDRIATHVLAFEGDSEVRWFEGNFSDYEADRHKRLGADADQPAPHQVQAAGPRAERCRRRARAIRIAVIVVCVAGMAGMIVTSATNHNGAAITFGLITAVAILCQMVVTTVLNEVNGAPGAPLYDTQVPPAPSDVGVEAEAAEVEERIAGLLAEGIDEAVVRDLVRHAVRLAGGPFRPIPDLSRSRPPPGADQTGDGPHDDRPAGRSSDRSRRGTPPCVRTAASQSSSSPGPTSAR